MRRIIGMGCALAFTLLLIGRPANAASVTPTITAPVSGAQLCPKPGTDFTVTGAGNPGLAINLLINDVVSGSTTTAEDGSYSIAVDRPSGSYELKTQQTTVDGTFTSDPVDVKVLGGSDVLGPVTSSPATISPKTEDGHFDTSKLTVSALRVGKIGFALYSGSALVTTSPLTTVAAPSTVAWTWNGRGSSGYNGGKPVNSGSYEARALWKSTSDTACSVLTRSGTVSVDNVAPTVSGYSASLATFYPRTDDALEQYRNTVRFTWSGITERSYVTVHLFTHRSSSSFKTLPFGYSTSGGSVTWDGRKPDGSIYPAGTYEWSIFMTDAVHNVRSTLKRHVVLSLKHLVRHSSTTKVNGKDFYEHAFSGCGGVSSTPSSFSDGVIERAVNCNDDAVTIDAAALFYAMSVPAANYYGQATFKVDGFSDNGDVLGGFFHNYATGDDDVVGLAHASTPTLTTFGTKSDAGRYVSSGRHIVGFLFLYSPTDCCDVEYDVRAVTLDLTYATLAN